MLSSRNRFLERKRFRIECCVWVCLLLNIHLNALIQNTFCINTVLAFWLPPGFVFVDAAKHEETSKIKSRSLIPPLSSLSDWARSAVIRIRWRQATYILLNKWIWFICASRCPKLIFILLLSMHIRVLLMSTSSSIRFHTSLIWVACTRGCTLSRIWRTLPCIWLSAFCLHDC